MASSAVSSRHILAAMGQRKPPITAAMAEMAQAAEELCSERHRAGP